MLRSKRQKEQSKGRMYVGANRMSVQMETTWVSIKLHRYPPRGSVAEFFNYDYLEGMLDCDIYIDTRNFGINNC
jgi:hypothetical protein